MRHDEYTEIADNFCKKHNITVKFIYTGLAINTKEALCLVGNPNISSKELKASTI